MNPEEKHEGLTDMAEIIQEYSALKVFLTHTQKNVQQLTFLFEIRTQVTELTGETDLNFLRH